MKVEKMIADCITKPRTDQDGNTRDSWFARCALYYGFARGCFDDNDETGFKNNIQMAHDAYERSKPHTKEEMEFCNKAEKYAKSEKIYFDDSVFEKTDYS